MYPIYIAPDHPPRAPALEELCKNFEQVLERHHTKILSPCLFPHAFDAHVQTYIAEQQLAGDSTGGAERGSLVASRWSATCQVGAN